MNIQEINAKLEELGKKIQTAAIPESIAGATQEDVDKMKLRTNLTIVVALAIFGGWSWLLYQAYTGVLDEYYFIALAALAVSGLFFFAVFYFAKILSVDLQADESYWEKIKRFFAASPEFNLKPEEYLAARIQFVKTIQMIAYVALAFALVSLAYVVQVLYNPLQYLPAEYNPMNYQLQYASPIASPVPPRRRR